MDESRWNEVLDPPAARLLSCPSANWIHIIIFSSNYSGEGFPGHISLDICIWAFFMGHISLDICIWAFLWVTFLWIFVFGHFCGSCFFGYVYLGILLGHISLESCNWAFLWVTFVKAVQRASSSPRCHFQQVGKHL